MAEINPGIWDGLSPEQARKYYPEDWERFSKDPYAFRAPRGESYHDLCSEILLKIIFFGIFPDTFFVLSTLGTHPDRARAGTGRSVDYRPLLRHSVPSGVSDRAPGV